MSSEQCPHGIWIVGIGHNPCVECSSRGTCARCGGYFPLSDDGTCWPCAVEYRDELIRSYRDSFQDIDDRLRKLDRAAEKANTLPSFGQQLASKG